MKCQSRIKRIGILIGTENLDDIKWYLYNKLDKKIQVFKKLVNTGL